MKKVQTVVTLVVLAGTLFALGCYNPGERSNRASNGSTASFPDSEKDAIRTALKHWVDAANAKQWDSVGAVYADDAVLLPPNDKAVEGRSAIAKWMGNFPAFKSISVDPVEIDGRHHLAFDRGTYTVDFGNGQSEHGKYIEIWRKHGGKWNIARDIFNSDEAPAAPATSKK